MRRILLGTTLAFGLAALAFSPAYAKTVKECDAEYAANKAAIQGTQKKADFITACRAGTEVIPGAAPATPAQAQTPAPAKPGLFGFGRKKPAATQAPASTSPSPPPAASTTPVGANQFASEAQAKGRCPSGLVVWVNTQSSIYHFPGTKNYGNTKAGAYMCETDATAAGDRASKTEKHP